MKSIKLVLISIAIVGITNLSYGQKTWTLEECINYAIENNISVKRQELGAKSAEKNFNQSVLEVLPNLNANGRHYYNSGKTLNQENYTYVEEGFQGGNIGISSELVVFRGLRNFNTIRKNKIDYLLQLENVEKVKNDITINVSTAYLQILLDKELRDNAKQQLEITLQQIEKTKKLVEIGNAAKGDLLQIEAQSASEKATLTNSENNLKLSYLDLIQLLNIEEIDNFEIAFPELPDISIDNNIADITKIFNDALAFLPEIKSAELNVESNEKGLSIAKGAISPTIAFGYNYSSRYNELSSKIEGDAGIFQTLSPTGLTEGGENVYSLYPQYNYASSYPYMEQISDNASHFVYLGIQIPLFNNWRTMNNISQARINLADSKLNLNLKKQNLLKGIQQARALAIAALDKYKANLESIISNTEAFRYTEQKYQVGLVDILEYNTAKNNLNKAKSDLAQAKYEFIFRTKILDFYKGEQITL